MKLTQGMRTHIAAQLLARRFDDENTALDKRTSALAERVYKDGLPEATRKKMASLPAGWLPEVKELRIAFGSGFAWLRLPEPKRVPSAKLDGAFKAYDATHALSVEWQAIKDARRDYADARDRLRAQLDAVLASVSTINKLIEVWPEAAPFVPGEQPTANLPAVNLKSLNKELKLPVKAAA